MKLQVFAALLILTLVPALPAAAQAPEGPTADDDRARATRMVTFYPHVFAATTFGPMPGNTQFPTGEEDFSAGYPDNGCYPESLSALGAVPRLPTGVGLFDDVYFPQCEEWTNNVLYVYSTAGFVNAHPDFWGYEDFHNERGQAKDILLDTTQDISATFYMSADFHPWFCAFATPVLSGMPNPYPCWNWDPGVFPDWQIEATFLLGNMGEYQGQASDPPPVHEKVLSGEVVEVARGESEPQDMVSLDGSLNNGQGEVYEFNINLGRPQVDKIPKEADWIMRFRWWARTDEGTKIIPGGQSRLNWNLNSGEFYPNRFQLPIKNPFDVELVFPQFLHDKLLLHAMLNSPWGSYDVDAKSVAIEVVDDVGRPADFLTVSRVADFSVAHGGHYKPVNVTWVWDYKADQARAGVYKATVTASNFQHSASSTTEALFRINADGTGTVLSVGRSGQQTSTQEQLATLGPRTGGSGDGLGLAPQAASTRAVPGVEPLLLLGAAFIVGIVTRRSRP